VTAPRISGADADRARAVRGLALAARSLEQAAGDLTLAQYRVLAFVAAGTERSSLVAEGLALAKPTVTAAVDGLVERKLLTREAIAGDRRSFRLAVTRAGDAALNAAEHAMGERLDRLLEYARDPEALVAALCDLDDALADRMRARLAREVSK
jgi:DNA-binding MarR family transcriptional regulator